MIRAMHWASCLTLFLIVITGTSRCAAAAERPNVIVILADDLGYADVSCYGGKIPTPHIDALAAQGMRFTDAHTSSSVCTPTRYGLLTGRYNWRSKLKRGVLGGLSPRLIEPNRLTVASLLKEQGYHSACIGKWHLGMNWVVKPGKQVSEMSIEPREQVFNVDYAQSVTNGPQSVGFDYFYGISASLDMVPYAFIENDRVTSLPTEDRDFPMINDREQGGRTRKGPAAPDFDAADVLPVIAQKSVAYIERRAEAAKTADARQPFFLYVPFASPHTPILPTPAWRGKSGLNAYGDFVMETDWAVGEILAALERNGLADETLVIFTSDNGCSPQAKFAELAELGHFPHGPLRGHKADIFEGGHRVPFVARWPGQIAAGRQSDQLVCLTDILATVAELTGAQVPDSAAEDSFSFVAALRGESRSEKGSDPLRRGQKPNENDSPPKGQTPFRIGSETGASATRDHLVSHSINGSFAIRQGPWKLLLCPDSGGWSAPRPGSKPAAELPSRQLYNLAEDLGEQNNLIDQEPQRAGQLLALLERLVEDGRSTSGPPQQNNGEVDLWAAAPDAR